MKLEGDCMLQVKAGLFEATISMTSEEGCKYVLLKENKVTLRNTIMYKSSRSILEAQGEFSHTRSTEKCEPKIDLPAKAY